jgi:GTP cyclohydrolase II
VFSGSRACCAWSAQSDRANVAQSAAGTFSSLATRLDVTPEILAESPLPTRHGPFRFIVFTMPGERLEHVALVRGDVRGAGVLARVHSECMTSEVFGSRKCDCAEQLDLAEARIAHAGRGVVVYLRQEGRGIGLANKIRAYALQARGLDTVDANRALGLPDDARTYAAAAAMLRALGVTSVRLLTNNPDKVSALQSLGIEVTSRVPIVVAAQPHSVAYLDAKRERMSHALPAREPILRSPLSRQSRIVGGGR